MEIIKKEELEGHLGALLSEDLDEECYLEALENPNDDFNKMVIEDHTINGVPYSSIEQNIEDFEGRYVDVDVTIKRMTDGKLFSANVQQWGSHPDEWKLTTDFKEVVSTLTPLEDRLTVELDEETLKNIYFEWDDRFSLVKKEILDFDGEKGYVTIEIVYHVIEHDKYLRVKMIDAGKGEISGYYTDEIIATEVFKATVETEVYL